MPKLISRNCQLIGPIQTPRFPTLSCFSDPKIDMKFRSHLAVNRLESLDQIGRLDDDEIRLRRVGKPKKDEHPILSTRGFDLPWRRRPPSNRAYFRTQHRIFSSNKIIA